MRFLSLLIILVCASLVELSGKNKKKSEEIQCQQSLSLPVVTTACKASGTFLSIAFTFRVSNPLRMRSLHIWLLLKFQKESVLHGVRLMMYNEG